MFVLLCMSDRVHAVANTKKVLVIGTNIWRQTSRLEIWMLCDFDPGVGVSFATIWSAVLLSFSYATVAFICSTFIFPSVTALEGEKAENTNHKCHNWCPWETVVFLEKNWTSITADNGARMPYVLHPFRASAVCQCTYLPYRSLLWLSFF